MLQVHRLLSSDAKLMQSTQGLQLQGLIGGASYGGGAGLGSNSAALLASGGGTSGAIAASFGGTSGLATSNPGLHREIESLKMKIDGAVSAGPSPTDQNTVGVSKMNLGVPSASPSAAVGGSASEYDDDAFDEDD